jgi:hypothetical protein
VADVGAGKPGRTVGVRTMMAAGVAVRAAGVTMGVAFSILRGLAVGDVTLTAGARGGGLTGTLRGTAGFSVICGPLNGVGVAVRGGGDAVGRGAGVPVGGGEVGTSTGPRITSAVGSVVGTGVNNR